MHLLNRFYVEIGIIKDCVKDNNPLVKIHKYTGPYQKIDQKNLQTVKSQIRDKSTFERTKISH